MHRCVSSPPVQVRTRRPLTRRATGCFAATPPVGTSTPPAFALAYDPSSPPGPHAWARSTSSRNWRRLRSSPTRLATPSPPSNAIRSRQQAPTPNTSAPSGRSSRWASRPRTDAYRTGIYTDLYASHGGLTASTRHPRRAIYSTVSDTSRGQPTRTSCEHSDRGMSGRWLPRGVPVAPASLAARFPNLAATDERR